MFESLRVRMAALIAGVLVFPFYVIGVVMIASKGLGWSAQLDLAMYTAIAGAAVFVVVLPLRFRPIERPKAGTCIECGYDLKGLRGDVCPECGGAIRSTQDAVTAGTGRTI